MICHLHDSNNRHVGTGRGSDKLEAMDEAVKSVADKGSVPKKGSFGCGDEQSIAHKKAQSINRSTVSGLPGSVDISG